MKPVLEKIHLNPVSSFSLKEEIVPYITIPWHYHPEYELTLFTEGHGSRLVGDYLEHFDPGDLIMLGPHLPHYWKTDPVFHEGRNDLRVRAIVVHFKSDFLGEVFFKRPEMGHVQQLFSKAEKGLKFTGDTQRSVSAKMERLLPAEGFERILILLDIFHELAKTQEVETLARIDLPFLPSADTSEQMERVYRYTLEHYRKELSLEAVADIAGMSVTSFCRFFKKRTGKTFTHFVADMRVGYACRLLIDTDYSVSQIGFDCGFNNLSYFYRTFARKTGSRPREYRKKFQVKG
jgi:AraC-like DNA-binding protein